MFKYNPLTGLDFYKTGHKPQYPEGTEVVYSNLTARSNKHFNWQQSDTGYVILWRLQGFIKEFLFEGFQEGFFELPKEQVIKAFKRRMKNAVGEIDVSHIEALHDLGYLPVHIKALPEGSKVPIGMPICTIKNTLPEFFWVTNFLETIISTEIWKSITGATIAFEYRKICEFWSQNTCDNNDHIPFQCHDFSMRGMSGWHDAACTGSGHLLSFSGTDTVPAIDYLEQYYGADSDKELVGASVPATEHSVMCMGGKEGEKYTVERLLTGTYPSGIFSCVLDTWDYFKVLTKLLPELRDEIMSRDGKFVVRPDSGDPVKIICGYQVSPHNLNYLGLTGNPFKSDIKAKAEGLDKAVDWAKGNGCEAFRYFGEYFTAEGVKLTEAEVKGSVELLWELFGGDYNIQGYKVLDSHIGLMYGDSITLDIANKILKLLAKKGFASSNVNLGLGSYSYQYVTRDTFGMAIKATWGAINGEGVEIFKDPATDDGTKKSAKGLLKAFVNSQGNYYYQDKCTLEEEQEGEYKTVFKDSVMFNFQSLAEVRERLASYL